MRALVTGGGGQLASDLIAALGPDSRAFPHAELDIRDDVAVQRAYDAVDPEIVFNCAAFHNVDVCERESDTAFAVNVDAVRRLAARGTPLVHFSTNYVFDGRRSEPYAEDDMPSPRSVYALTKLAGEHAALAYGSRTLVVRSAGLYGLRGSESKGGNFVQRMLRRAREQGELRMVADQRLQPTFTRDLAAATLEAVGREASGILHLTAGGACSWFDFTQAILELSGTEASLEPVSTHNPPGSPDRPLNGVLAHARAPELGLTPLRGWREALAEYISGAASSDGPAPTTTEVNNASA